MDTQVGRCGPVGEESPGFLPNPQPTSAETDVMAGFRAMLPPDQVFSCGGIISGDRRTLPGVVIVPEPSAQVTCCFTLGVLQ